MRFAAALVLTGFLMLLAAGCANHRAPSDPQAPARSDTERGGGGGGGSSGM